MATLFKMKEYYLQIFLNQDIIRYSSRYTIKDIEEYIESKLKFRENAVQNLIQTSEYQFVRPHIVEILQKQYIYSYLSYHNEVQNGIILIKFVSYNTDMFVIPNHENIRFRFSSCEFNVLDYSGSNLDKLECEEFYHNQIKHLILPSTLLWLQLNDSWKDNYNNKITSLSFQSYDITYITIYRIMPENIYFLDQHINKEILDFSQFNKLKVLHLDNINQDIMIPDCLEEVKISSKSKEFKVLNKFIQADDIQFRNITLLGKTFLEHCKIRLHSCIIDYIMINDLYYQINNDEQSALVIKEYNSIQKYDKINKIFILNTNVEIISLHSNTQIFVVNPILISQLDNSTLAENLLFPSQNLEGYKELMNQSQPKVENTDVGTQRHPADLSQLTSLKSYHNQRQSNNVLFPAQIQDISLIFNTKNDMDCFQKDSQQPLVFDLSYLTQLQKLSLELYQMESVCLFQSKLQFILQQDQQQKIIIKMQDKQQSQLDFITRVTFIDISNLENIIIDGQVKDVIDFSQFLSLKELNLQNINKKVVLPINLQLLYMKDSSEQNFDLRDYKDLKSVDFLQCQFYNLITENTVRIIECTIKYFNAEYIKNLLCYHNNSIDICESFDTKTSLILNKINIKVLKLDNFENLHELNLSGINTIIVNNSTYTEGILDFTIFPSLSIVYLQKTICSEIKFGDLQTKITIYSTINKLQHLDFTNCRIAEIIVENCEVDVVSLTSHRIQFKNCKVKLINLCWPETHYKLRKFASACAGSCKWIVQYKKNTRQRILYKMHYQRSKDYKRDCAYKYSLRMSVEIALSCKLKLIWEKLRQLMYE